jgi:hypothetical protein
MGMTTTSTTVTISGSVSTTPTPFFNLPYGTVLATQTRVTRNGVNVLGAGATSNVYNVTGGKTLYITNIHLAVNGMPTSVEIRDNATSMWQTAFVAGSSTASASSDLVVPISFATNVTLYTGGATTLYWSFEGFEM